MKRFEVTTKFIDEESTVDIDSYYLDMYYISEDDKVCFKVKGTESIRTYQVICFNRSAIDFAFRYNDIVSIKHIEDFESKFDPLAKTVAGLNWIQHEKEWNVSVTDLGEYDKECSESVQEEYNKLGYIPRPKYSEF